MLENFRDKVDREPSCEGSPLGEQASISLPALFLFYGLALGVGWVWGESPERWFVCRFVDVALGVGVGLGLVGLSLLYRHFSLSAQTLELELRRALGRIGKKEIACYTVLSALGEEVFFRGAMQGSFGLVLTAVIFGFLHGGFRSKLLPWSVFALGAGFAFGWMMDWTGSLCAPIIAHGLVNGINLTRISRLECK